MKKLYILLFIICIQFGKAKAQWVTIPDANFVAWLTANYPSCMNGNQMDNSCSAIINETSVDVSGLNISNLSGIQYFINLQSLNCSSNQLTTLPSLPSSLTGLDCSYNLISSLPTLPNSITGLSCSSNQLTSLPNLPSSLIGFSCSLNQLNSLPSLPNTITNLDCSSNQLSSLPNLPSSLPILNCSYNQLTSLPPLPNSIYALYCDNNQLSNLPTLPNSLGFLHCEFNQLSILPSLPFSLINLTCNDNLLNNLPALQLNLNALYCDHNLLTSLPTLPFYLEELGCSFNQITTLPTFTNTNSLIYLNCSSNSLSNLPALPNSLKTLICKNNQLSSLPILPNLLIGLTCDNNQLGNLPSLPNSLTSLSCSNNQLSSISQVANVMNYFKIDYNNISCINNLPQVDNVTSANISNNPISCVPNQTNYSLGLPLCEALDVINNPTNCPSVVNITGNVYIDMNGNCTYDYSDWETENIPVKVYDTQNNLKQISYSINGIYSFASLPVDTYLVKINDVALPLAMACGQSNSQTVSLTSTTQSLLNNNFPVVCDSAFDLEVHSVTHQGLVFPGQVHTLNTNLANDASWYNLICDPSSFSGIVTINVSGPVTYVSPTSGALLPQISGNTFTYNIVDFNTLTPTSFGLQFLTDTTAQAGNQICVHVTIAATPSDLDTSNNEYDFCYNVVNSYDPNMKEVYPTDVLPGYNNWFTYTIHFQNTGTAPAFNIRLRDTLDTQLDLNTFEFLGASHTASTTLNGRVLSVRFNNIMLPDSTSDYNGSMGYYQYRIKPLPNITNGSTIENTAYIYFDYNPAIVTNTTQNNFDITVSNSVLPKVSNLWLYPNPSSGIFTFNETQNLKTVEVFNLLGEQVLTQGNQKQLNLSSFSRGIYFAKINGQQVLKLIKEN